MSQKELNKILIMHIIKEKYYKKKITWNFSIKVIIPQNS